MKSWKKWPLAAVVLFLGATLAACGGSSSPRTDSYTPGGEIKAPLLLNSTAHAGGQGWGRADCLACHIMERVETQHQRVPKIQASLMQVAELRGGEVQRTCLACHDTNGLDPVADRQCLICHGDNRVLAGAGLFTKEHTHTITNIGGSALADADCVVCHERSNMDGSFDKNEDLTRFRAGVDYDSINDFCLSCHDIDGVNVPTLGVILPPPLRYPNEYPKEPVFTDIGRSFMGTGSTEGERRTTADFHGFGRGTDLLIKQVGGNKYRDGYDQHDHAPLLCTDCHLVHSSSNHYLITESGASASGLTDPEARAASVAVSERNFEQLCAICHTNDDGPVVGNGLTGISHIVGYPGDCVSCHYHGAGYIEDRF